MPAPITEWNNFFVATASAAAALTGLLFVGVSMSLTRILSFPALPTRAMLSLTLLLTVLVHSILMLVPEQSLQTLGIEIMSAGSIAWFCVLKMDISSFTKIERLYKKAQAWNILIDQVALIPYIIAGICIFFYGETGIYWLVPAFIFSILKAVMDAWVLLIEIHR